MRSTRACRFCRQCLQNLCVRDARARKLSAHRDCSISTFGFVRALSQRLHVGANDIADPADFGVAVDFVYTGFFLAKTILQGFNCDIESDFVPKLETVGNGLRG